MNGTYEPKVTPWTIREADFPSQGTAEEKAAFLLRYAILAPSSHNSQPWRFAIRDNSILVYIDERRWLKVADADRRELYISAGCALENLLTAAGHFGYGYEATYFPTGDEEAAARVELQPGNRAEPPRDGTLFTMMTRRSTNHATYDSRRITVTDLDRLRECCVEEGFRLLATSDAKNEPEIRDKVTDLTARADALQYSDRAYKKELAWWIGRGVFGASPLAAKVTKLAVTYLNITSGQVKKDTELLRSAPTLMVLVAANNDRRTQIMAGRIYERIALTAAGMGLAVHPMSQILEVPALKNELAALVPGAAAYPQHAFRLGYAAPEKSHTPRRPLEEVLIR